MAKRYSTKDLASLPAKKVLIDANVLIYIFWPTGENQLEIFSSNTFGYLLRKKIDLVTDFNTISEVINRVLRIEYENHLIAENLTKKDLSFKKFRDGDYGNEIIDDTYTIVEYEILQKIGIVGKSFSQQDVLSFLTNDGLDFQDKAIVTTCKEHDCILYTNDGDFKNVDIDILTSNNKILN